MTTPPLDMLPPVPSNALPENQLMPGSGSVPQKGGVAPREGYAGSNIKSGAIAGPSTSTLPPQTRVLYEKTTSSGPSSESDGASITDKAIQTIEAAAQEYQSECNAAMRLDEDASNRKINKAYDTLNKIVPFAFDVIASEIAKSKSTAKPKITDWDLREVGERLAAEVREDNNGNNLAASRAIRSMVNLYRQERIEKNLKTAISRNNDSAFTDAVNDAAKWVSDPHISADAQFIRLLDVAILLHGLRPGTVTKLMSLVSIEPSQDASIPSIAIDTLSKCMGMPISDKPSQTERAALEVLKQFSLGDQTKEKIYERTHRRFFEPKLDI